MTADAVVVELEVPNQGVQASVEVMRPYFIPFGDVRVVQRSETRVRLRLVERGGASRTDADGNTRGDATVGSLPILSANAVGGFDVKYLELPPPAPFAVADIEWMWRAMVSLPVEVASAVRRDALSAASARVGGVFPHLPALGALIESARFLIHQWPERESAELYWRFVDLPGGREDVRQTLSRPMQAGGLRLGSRRVAPQRTMRRRATYEPWRLASVAAVAREAVRCVDRLADESLTIARDSLSRVADLASPGRDKVPDLPASSWPDELRAFFDQAIEFIAGVHAHAQGASRAPLCHVWQLYEAWVSAKCFDAVVAELGAPESAPYVDGANSQGQPIWRSRWTPSNGVTVHLLAQSEYRKHPTSTGIALVSCTAALIPDCLLLVENTDRIEVVAFDAKYRGSTPMTAGELCAAGAKYMWGIRRESSPESAGLRETVVVSSAGSTQAIAPALAMISGVRATPAHTTDLDLKVRAVLRELIADGGRVQRT